MKHPVLADLHSAPVRMRRPLRFALRAIAAPAALLAALPAFAAASAEWSSAVNMAAARHAPTVTPLTGKGTLSGRILVVGGYTGSTCTTSAQLFNPSAPAGTSPWATAGSLRTGRSFATATDFGDGTGRVLLAGGFTTNIYGQWVTQRSAEIYNPATNAFSYVTRTVNRRATQVSMNTARELFTGTRLPNGKILLVGGIYGGQTTVRSAELFDPVAMTITYTGSMKTPSGRFGHDAVVIPPDPSVSGDQGKVLVVGGKEHAADGWHSLQTAELYDVATGTFTSIPMLQPRDRPRVAWVPTVGARGMVLVVGGKSDDPRDPAAVKGDVLQCEWFDPATTTFVPGPLLQQGRMAHTLTPLGDGSFLAAGGWSGTLGRSTETAERFVPNLDPAASEHGAFVSLSFMADPRQDHGAAMLPPAAGTAGPIYRALVAGGKPNVGGKDTYLNRAEIYTQP